MSLNVLRQYIALPNIFFFKEGISVKTQKEFNIMFSINDERIVIPIFDEIGNLVGVKGRTINKDEENRYIYFYPCPRNKILYGLYKTLEYIKKTNEVIIFESEKSVLQAWSMGYKNCVALGGKSISETQLEKILKLNTDVTFAWDKDIDIEYIKEKINDFKLYTNVNVIYDKWNLLKDKDSPTDRGIEIWEKLYNNKFKC